jgi:alpha-galactosidase
MPPLPRRSLLKIVPVGIAAAAAPWTLLKDAVAVAAPDKERYAGDDEFGIEFDSRLRTRLHRRGVPVTAYSASEALLLPDGVIDTFGFAGSRTEVVDDARHGSGRRTVVDGVADGGVKKRVEVTFFERYPGFALLKTTYTNAGDAALKLAGWRNASHRLAGAADDFWTFSGATHEDRRDWACPVTAGFDERNSLAMVASDYGGGTPAASIWSREIGLAVGHVEAVPRLVDMPVQDTGKGAGIAVEHFEEHSFAPGATLHTYTTFVCLHTGDYYTPLALYAAYMANEGIAAPAVPESAFAPVWCAWGYERNFNTEQVLATLPKVRELGFEWAVLDDGWQTNEGDWDIDKAKFPRGEADMRAFVDAVRAQGLRPRIWIAPLAADPGSNVLHEHADMLLLDEWGAFQTVSWWNALTQCPAYQPVIDYYTSMVKKIVGEWGFEGLKLDGQHLNSVAPCYNPKHAHAHPNESFEKLPDFWNAIHAAAREVNPEAVVELCPCGTAFSFHNLPATDQFPSSDPLSSRQVRQKGKTVKALMGSRGSFAGDHVELSDGGRDFASSVGVGAVISTKFTWPADTDSPTAPLPPGGYRLTPEKEALWRKWVELYKTHGLPKGEYLGSLYDIAFDKPEAHAIAANGAIYYTFYADEWKGRLQLRGLGREKYRVRDLYNDADLGEVDAKANTLDAAFKGFLFLQAQPVERSA